MISQIIAAKLAGSPGGGWLELDQAAGLLAACGLPVLPTRGAATAAQAAAAAEAVGFPVVLKARSGDVVHKSDVGGVALGLADSEAVRAAYETMQARLGAQMGGAVIQPMAPPGVEAIVGLAADPEFGPVVMAGLGGVLTDLLQDRAFAVPPLEPGAADAMVASLRAARCLTATGARRKPTATRSWRCSSRSPASPRKFPNSSSSTSTPSWSAPPERSPSTARPGWPPASQVPARCSPRCAAGRRF